MNGAKGPTNGAPAATSGTALSGDSLRRITAARERFAAGADSVRGVRPEILMSWYRCREEYEVDPGLDRAPAAGEASRPNARGARHCGRPARGASGYRRQSVRTPDTTSA